MTPVVAQESARIGSWNIEHFGNRRFGQHPAAIADYLRMANVDVLALQEIYDTDGAGAPYRNRRLDDVITELNQQPGQAWKYVLFPKRDPNQARQLCGIMWNSHRISPVGDAWKIPLDHANGTLWDRHPYAMKFQIAPGKTDFVLIPVHMKSNVTDEDDEHQPVERRSLEAMALKAVFNQIKQHFNDDDIVILGDTNCLASDEEALSIFGELGLRDLNEKDAATYISGSNKAPFDHILVPDKQPEFRFARQYMLMPTDSLKFRGSLSDHVLVLATLQVENDDDGPVVPVPNGPALVPMRPGVVITPQVQPQRLNAPMFVAGPTPNVPEVAAALPSAGQYYINIDHQASGSILKSQLHHLIRKHQKLSYDSLWNHLSYTDESRSDPTKVELFYTGWLRGKDKHGGNSPSNWNREHVWAKSRGRFGTKGAGADLHHIRATDVSVNEARGNLAFDEGGEFWEDGDGKTKNRVDHDSWEPRDEVKGDVARMLFYMAVRYEGNGEPDLELEDVVSTPNGKAPRIGKLSVLLKWHATDKPDDDERRRNDRIHERQGNRNPFIDHPEWVSRIWP